MQTNRVDMTYDRARGTSSSICRSTVTVVSVWGALDSCMLCDHKQTKSIIINPNHGRDGDALVL